MLVPGFTVRELPVKLPNVNTLRFAPDGRLTALGYDGRVWLLRDSDGDGLEDTAELFWDKPTISVPVGMAWSTDGLYVSSHGKVSLLRDTDGDGKADTEEIIASGWPPTDVASGGVDATAVTLDNEGNVYFGLLVADYSNAYRLRKRKDLKPEERARLEARGDRGGDPEDQVSLYDIQSKRGTIQKWHKSTGKLETIATGIRVPYTLAFNRNGDLFNTDQEGETWMPNGNPLDELNHIIPGRNYGFPPRHEKWLPDLVSEPPVVAFGPQHQSTCGLVFNEPHGPLHATQASRPPRSESKHKSGKTPGLPCSPGQGLFGPKWWEGDAFVAGESRGKIWRVRLVKTPHGYVGKEFLIARLSMLTLDLAISPGGDLYVCCHSGLPDWGTGPQGEGKIFRISYKGKGLPLPTAIWPRDETNVVVSFYGQLGHLGYLKPDALKIDYGEFVTPAEQFEVLKPPYEVVKRQSAAPRSELRVNQVEASEFQLIAATEPHPVSAGYALTLPELYRNLTPFRDAPGVRLPAIPPEPAYLAYDFQGVLFTAVASSWGSRLYTNSIWYPHLLRKVTSSLAQWSERHVGFDGFNRTARQFRMDTMLDYPSNSYTLELAADSSFTARLGDVSRKSSSASNGTHQITLNWFSNGRRVPLEITFEQNETAKNTHWNIPKVIDAVTTAADDRTPRVVPPSRLWLPYSPHPVEQSIPATSPAIEITGGDFERGRSLFFSDQLKCSTCHRLRGEGGLIGPDLSNLVSRDAASVLRDIKEPNVSINPDYVAYNVTLNNGAERTGFIRAQENATIQLLGADGQETRFRPTDVKELRVSSVSLMPAGLLDALNAEQVADLLTFLLNDPPKRSSAEVEAVLKAGPPYSPPNAIRQLNIVLVASKQDHGPGQHDYPSWQQSWLRLLTTAATNVIVTTAWEWPTEEQFKSADAIVFYFWNHDCTAGRYQQLDNFLGRGGGVVLFHSATIADKEPEQLAERMGLASQPQRTKYLHTPLDLKIVAPPDHPLTIGLPRQIHFLDEPYWPMIGDATKIEVLATTNVEGEDRPMMWTFQKGPGRVFGSILGHYTWTHDDPLFRLIAFRGLAWAAGEPTGRFDGLALKP